MIKELGLTKMKVARAARSAREALILDGIEEGLKLALERLLAAGVDPVEARRMLWLE